MRNSGRASEGADTRIKGINPFKKNKNEYETHGCAHYMSNERGWGALKREAGIV
jgi:hypothetical protein